MPELLPKPHSPLHGSANRCGPTPKFLGTRAGFCVLCHLHHPERLLRKSLRCHNSRDCDWPYLLGSQSSKREAALCSLGRARDGTSFLSCYPSEEWHRLCQPELGHLWSGTHNAWYFHHRAVLGGKWENLPKYTAHGGTSMAFKCWDAVVVAGWA